MVITSCGALPNDLGADFAVGFQTPLDPAAFHVPPHGPAAVRIAGRQENTQAVSQAAAPGVTLANQRKCECVITEC